VIAGKKALYCSCWITDELRKVERSRYGAGTSLVIVLETERLILRRLSTDDSEFVLELLNEPSFLHYIGDRGVRNLEDAAQYILNRLVASYERNGFGLYLVELREDRIPIGISGLVKRDTLPDADIGFAFLPAYWSKGYALESAAAVMSYAKEKLGLNRILAITSPDNEASAKLLGKIGLRFERMIKLSEDDAEVKLFTPDHPPATAGGTDQ
jgi:RimJ/RimL family protein N-acetyltransferase